MLDATQYAQHYERNFNRTVRFLCSMGLDEENARESAQAAWVRGWERREQVRNPERILSWVNSIAINIYRTQLRHERGRVPLPTLSSSPAAITASLDADRVLNMCEQTAREMMEQHYLLGFQMKEVAMEHGCSEVAVRIRLYRTRQALRERLSRKPAGAAASLPAAA